MMRRLVTAEWLRFHTNPVNRWVLGIFLLVFLLSGLWAGLSARELRQQHQHEIATWQQQFDEERKKLSATDVTALPPEKRARITFDFARHSAPPALLHPLPGLALSTNPFDLFDTVNRVTITNRYTDNRKSEILSNPQLDETGSLDFATLAALLIPILCICLSYGLLQEDKESGVWRLTAMTHPHAWQVLAAALFVRWLTIVACLGLSSAMALGIDQSISPPAFLSWMAAGSGFVGIWIALSGLFCLLPISSGASALAQLATWTVSSFVVPTVLMALSPSDSEKSPSRMANIAQMRVIQLDADAQATSLLDDWYAKHRQAVVPVRSHIWPVSWMPKYEAESLRMRYLFRSFDRARAERDNWLAAWGWLAPNIALLDTADRLAGINITRYLAYISAVDDYEDRWRNAFMPKVMHYEGLRESDLTNTLPPFDWPDSPASCTHSILRLWLAVLGVFFLIFLFRRRAEKP